MENCKTYHRCGYSFQLSVLLGSVLGILCLSAATGGSITSKLAGLGAFLTNNCNMNCIVA